MVDNSSSKAQMVSAGAESGQDPRFGAVRLIQGGSVGKQNRRPKNKEKRIVFSLVCGFFVFSIPRVDVILLFCCFYLFFIRCPTASPHVTRHDFSSFCVSPLLLYPLNDRKTPKTSRMGSLARFRALFILVFYVYLSPISCRLGGV